MNRIERSALVARPAEAMYALVADVEAYPRRFAWCTGAEVLGREADAMTARLDLQLAEGPFKRLHGRWEFKPLSAEASKVSLLLEFETASSLLGPVIRLGMTGLADRMVDDFVRTARAEAA